MSVATAAREAAAVVQIYLADPVTGDPAIPTQIQTPANNLFSTFKGVAIVVAVFCLVGAGVSVFLSHQSGRPNDGMGKVGAVFAGLGVIILSAVLVGSVTGT